MSRKAPEPTRQNFEAGRIDKWTAGSYGASVQVKKQGRGLTILWRDPVTDGRLQKQLFSADSRELRREATRTAIELSEMLRSGKAEQAAAAPVAETMTLEDACLLYMQGRVPGFTREMLDWTPGKVEAWYMALPQSVRDHAPSVDTLNKDLRSYRSLWAHPRFARTRRVMEVEPGDWRQAQQDLLQKYTPRTLANWRDRLSLVFRYIRTEHRKSVGLLENPMEGAKAVRTKARIPRYTEDERKKLRGQAERALTEGRHWRLWVLLGISHSGRRVEAMLSLTAADHDLEKGTVTWRADVAKGGNYGRGDDVRRLTALHRRAVKWAMENHPNPQGPEYPLIWHEDDSTRPAPYGSVLRQWHQLEKDAEVETIKQRAFHSMRRSIVTLLAAKLGVEDAADYVGMTPATANEFFYRQTTNEQMEKAAVAIDEELGEENG